MDALIRISNDRPISTMTTLLSANRVVCLAPSHLSRELRSRSVLTLLTVNSVNTPSEVKTRKLEVRSRVYDIDSGPPRGEVAADVVGPYQLVDA